MKEKIIVLLLEVKDSINREDITDDSDLINDLGIDSLQMINLFLQLEDEFDFELDFEALDFNHMRSLKKLISFLEEKVAQN